MEILSLFLLLLLIFVCIKILGALFQAGFFVICLPFKLLAAAFSGLVVFFILLPLGLFAALAVLGSILPVVLVLIGIILLLKKS